MLVFMVLSYGTLTHSCIWCRIQNTRFFHWSQGNSKLALGFERELVNKKVILYGHVFLCTLDWFNVRYLCNYIQNYDKILGFYFSLNWMLASRSVFFLVFSFTFMQMKRRICTRASEWSEFWLNTVCHDELFGLLASRTN